MLEKVCCLKKKVTSLLWGMCVFTAITGKVSKVYADTVSLGGVWSFNVPEIVPGEPLFNYFFSLVMAFGLVCVPVAVLIRIVSKS